MDAAPPSMGERLAASAIGALLVGILAALAGFGPERIVTAIVAATAATFGGVLLDDFVAARARAPARAAKAPRPAALPEPQRERHRSERTAGAPVAPPPSVLDEAPRQGAAAPLRPQVTVAAAAAVEPAGAPAAGDDASTAAEPAPPVSVTPPPARWVEVQGPNLDQPSPRWTTANLDLVAMYLSHPDEADMACLRCGRTVERPEGEWPDDCPSEKQTHPCALESRPALQVTTFRALRDVFGGPADDLD